jgi:hypothetical protein
MSGAGSRNGFSALSAFWIGDALLTRSNGPFDMKIQNLLPERTVLPA